VRISLERVTVAEPETKAEQEEPSEKLTSSKLAQKLGVKTAELIDRLVKSGHLEMKEGKPYPTSKGKEAGGEFRMSAKFGPYFLWPEAFRP
jgi:hypothetical protein